MISLAMGWEDLLYYAEGCARGSHLRQHVWRRFIDEVYPRLNDRERECVYVYAKSDISKIYAPYGSDGYRHFGYDDFEMFLSCYDPGNRYRVTFGTDGPFETAECFLHKGKYYLGYNSWISPSSISDVEKVEKPRRLKDDGTAA